MRNAAKVQILIAENLKVVSYTNRIFPNLVNEIFDNKKDAFANSLFAYRCMQINNYNTTECKAATDAYQRSARYKPESRVIDLLNAGICRALALKSKPNITFEKAAEDISRTLENGCLFITPIDLCSYESNRSKWLYCLTNSV